MEAAVGIDGDDDVAIGGGEAGISDAGEVFGIFAGNDSSGLAGDFFGAVGAAIEDDDGFDFAGGDFGGFGDGIEAFGEVVFFVMGGDDDGDFHSGLRKVTSQLMPSG